jgi:hypothetical protein
MFEGAKVMLNLKTLGGAAAAIAIAVASLGVSAPSAVAKSPAQVGPAKIKSKVLKSAVFICNIGHRPNIVVLTNHNNFKIPKGAKIFFVASNAKHIVAQGNKILGHTLLHNGKYRIQFNIKRVRYYGKPTGCRAYARWVA